MQRHIHMHKNLQCAMYRTWRKKRPAQANRRRITTQPQSSIRLSSRHVQHQKTPHPDKEKPVYKSINQTQLPRKQPTISRLQILSTQNSALTAACTVATTKLQHRATAEHEITNFAPIFRRESSTVCDSSSNLKIKFRRIYIKHRKRLTSPTLHKNKTIMPVNQTQVKHTTTT